MPVPKGRRDAVNRRVFAVPFHKRKLACHLVDECDPMWRERPPGESDEREDLGEDLQHTYKRLARDEARQEVRLHHAEIVENALSHLLNEARMKLR